MAFELWYFFPININSVTSHIQDSLENVIFNFRTLSIFPALEIKKLALVCKVLWRFKIILQI